MDVPALCAIDALLALRAEKKKGTTRDTRQSIKRWLGRSAQLAVPGSVKFSKATVFSKGQRHVQNRATVTPEGLEILKGRYETQFLGQTEDDSDASEKQQDQPKLVFPPPAAIPAVTEVAALGTSTGDFSASISEFTLARQNFVCALHKEIDRVCAPAKEITVLDVLKKLGMPKLNQSHVGAKATLHFKKRYNRLRELPKRKTTLPTGVPITMNVWTEDEEKFLRLAALEVYAAQQPNPV